MSWQTFVQPAVISIVVSAITTCFIAPWAASKFNRKNAKELEKNKALINTIGQLMDLMEEINSYLFRYESYAMRTIEFRKYRYPMIDVDFIKQYGESIEEFTILTSKTSLFWKENEDYFSAVDDPKVIQEVDRYLKLVNKQEFSIRKGVNLIRDEGKQKVLYPEIPIDIQLYEASIRLGKLRWNLIDKY